MPNTKDSNICPLCSREMPEGSFNEHHLIPATFKGKEKITLHKVCHNAIHRTFTERELINYYHTIDRILENEDMVKFVKWIKKRPNDYYKTHKETRNRKNKRRR